MSDQATMSPYVGVSTKPCVDADISLYRELTTALTLPPTAFLLLHMGPEARGLFDRRGSDAETWCGFRRAVTDLAAYAASGLPAPMVIYVDEVCDRPKLRAAVSLVLAPLEGDVK